MRRYLVCDEGFNVVEQWTPGCWVNVECPDRDDFRFLEDELNIPEQILTYTSDIDERPRIERNGDWVLTILRIPAKSDSPDEPIFTVPISIITREDVIVTICYHRTELIDDFIEHTRMLGIMVEGKSTFILRLIFSSAFWFLKYLQLINDEVESAEKKLEQSVKNEDLLHLLGMQKSLVYFNTSLRGNEVLISRLRHVFTDDFDLDLLEDVEIELKQAQNTVNIYTEILNGTLDTYASVISNNVNAIMKRMTGTTIVLMIPTLVASFFGMNVAFGLENKPDAFWAIVVGTAVLTAGTFVLLRRIRWF